MKCTACGTSITMDVAQLVIQNSLVLKDNPDANVTTATDQRLRKRKCWVCSRTDTTIQREMNEMVVDNGDA